MKGGVIGALAGSVARVGAQKAAQVAAQKAAQEAAKAAAQKAAQAAAQKGVTTAGQKAAQEAAKKAAQEAAKKAALKRASNKTNYINKAIGDTKGKTPAQIADAKKKAGLEFEAKNPKTTPPAKPGDGSSGADVAATAAGAAPVGGPGGSGQGSGYSGVATDLAMMGAMGGLQASGSFLGAAAAAGSPEAIAAAAAAAAEKGKRQGEEAAAKVGNALGEASKGSPQGIVSGNTTRVKRKNEKKCICPKDYEMLQRYIGGLTNGTKKIVGMYFKIIARCKCTSDKEQQRINLINRIMKSRAQIMMNGSTFGKSGLYKYIEEKLRKEGTLPPRTRRRGLGPPIRTGGTRKKSRHVVKKKSTTRKQNKQKAQSRQSRRRTRKN